MSLVFNSCYKDALWLDLGRLFIGFGIGIITYVVRSIYANKVTMLLTALK